MGRGLVAASGRAREKVFAAVRTRISPSWVKTSCSSSRAASRPWPGYTSGQPYYLTYGDYFAIRDQSRFLRAVSPVLEREDIHAVEN